MTNYDPNVPTRFSHTSEMVKITKRYQNLIDNATAPEEGPDRKIDWMDRCLQNREQMIAELCAYIDTLPIPESDGTSIKSLQVEVANLTRRLDNETERCEELERIHRERAEEIAQLRHNQSNVAEQMMKREETLLHLIQSLRSMAGTITETAEHFVRAPK